jgi:hypothetical protein
MALTPYSPRSRSQENKMNGQHNAKDSKLKTASNQEFLEKVMSDVCDERDQLRFALSDAMAKVQSYLSPQSYPKNTQETISATLSLCPYVFVANISFHMAREGLFSPSTRAKHTQHGCTRLIAYLHHNLIVAVQGFSAKQCPLVLILISGSNLAHIYRILTHNHKADTLP